MGNNQARNISRSSSNIRSRRMHRVPPQIIEYQKNIYDPVIISIGPYHHGKKDLDQGEKLKDDILKKLLASAEDKDLFRGKIREIIDDIRQCYDGLDKRYNNSDDAFVDLMVRDACFVFYLMKGTERVEAYKIFRLIGRSRTSLVNQDIMKLENQIPLLVIKHLVDVIYKGKKEWDEFLCKFLSKLTFVSERLKKVPWEPQEEPLHLLEAYWKALLRHELRSTEVSNFAQQLRHVFQPSSRTQRPLDEEEQGSLSEMFERFSHSFRSVMDLKAKGIKFRPSSNCLTDIRFNSYIFHGKLEMPIWFVTHNTTALFSNMIAFEMSLETSGATTVTSYVNFLKSLIVNANDVNELREKKILFSNLDNDEEVVKALQEIEIYGFEKVDNKMDEVKTSIEEHCKSKRKTWMAELIHTYFRNPWTIIALFAASLLLCLTFLQTFFTISPPK